ncbi:hypothetical protein AMTR_s00128p00058460, partial [Amborella trichopoda]
FLTPEQRLARARIALWVACRIRPFSLDRSLITELCLRYRSETCSIPLRCGNLAPTLEDVTQILGVRSEGEPFFSIPPGMSTSYASNCKELLEIRLEKLRWEFTEVPHRAERMMGGRASQVSALVEEDGAGESESVQGEFSHPLSRCAAQSSGDAERDGCDIPDLGNGSTFFDEDTMPP